MECGAPTVSSSNGTARMAAASTRTSASPSSDDIRRPTTLTGRSICTATVPEPISSPTSSMVRVRGPMCAAWAAAMYQISAVLS